MISEKDIYASAKIFIDQHGDKALLEAMKKITEFETKGDVEGRECWNQIAGAIEWMQVSGDLSGEPCH